MDIESTLIANPLACSVDVDMGCSRSALLPRSMALHTVPNTAYYMYAYGRNFDESHMNARPTSVLLSLISTSSAYYELNWYDII